MDPVPKPGNDGAMTYAFDSYGAEAGRQALAELLAHRDKLTEPISWIKLQQGGQSEIAVSHVTVNHGMGRDRDAMLEVSLELDLTGEFPSHIEETGVDEDEALAMLVRTYDLDEDEAWETPESILLHELMIACAYIREGLREAGIAVEDECVLCCGDEDNTWGWSPGRSFDEATNLEASDFEELGDTDPTSFIEQVYATEPKRAWLRALLQDGK